MLLVVLYLINENFNPDVILCSPSKRTTETAINLVEELGINEQIIDYQNVIYNASVRELLNVLNNVDTSYEEVLIIGHNPAITYFGEYLTGSNIGNIQPSGVVKIEFEIFSSLKNFEQYFKY